MEFDELVGGFAKRMGLAWENDGSGSFSFSADDLPVTVLHLDELEQVALVGEVGEPPPEEHVERLYRGLLMANHTFSGTNGATLSLNPESGVVSLCRLFPLATLEGDAFYAAVEKFVDTLDTWHRIVADFRGELSADAAAAAQGKSAADVDAPPSASPAGDFDALGGSFLQV